MEGKKEPGAPGGLWDTTAGGREVRAKEATQSGMDECLKSRKK